MTRWCDLLLTGLAGVDWEVLALGVAEGRDTRCGVRIRYPRAIRDSGVDGRVLEGLAELLFGNDAEPQRLMDALIGLRRGADVSAAISPDALCELLIDVAPSELRNGPEPLTVPAVRAASELVSAVVQAATTPMEPCDVTLSATAGVAAVPGALERYCNGTPMVVVEHGIYVGEAHARTEGSAVDDWTRWLVRSSAENLARLAYMAASAVVGVSESNVVASRRLGCDPETSVCIPTGVDPPADPPPVRSSYEVGTVARIDPFKGVDLFVEASALIGERFENSTFTHIGPAEPTLEAYTCRCSEIARRSGLGTRLAFLGAHPDPPSILPRLHVQVIPSRSEGLPFSLLEGMAAGRAIVATEVGGIPEALGDAGLIVGPGDAREMADAVSMLLADPSEASRLGRLAHRVVRERYPIQSMLDGYSELFSSLHSLEAVA
ncbi:MAG: glycosyltransferase [Microthrixaceae bacterium]|nr:glycosyltransferase [Microthrixaceae bacterium]